MLIVSLLASSQTIARANLTPSDNGVGQLNLKISVVQGQGEICVSGRDMMPVCTTSSQTVAINNSALIHVDSTPDTGFVWDRYDGLGVGQPQSFNANITQDVAAGVYFVPASGASTNVTVAASPVIANTTTTIIPTDAAAPINLSNVSTTTTLFNDTTMSVTATTDSVNGGIPPSTNNPATGNVTLTVTQYLNRTISVTQTVANATVSYTVTHTVANTTVTQANETVTVTATTTTASTTGP